MIEEKTLKYLSFLTPYAVSICALYIFGFWSTFGVNILEFISLSDVAKLGIYPIVFGTLGLLIGWFLPFLRGSSSSPDVTKNQDETQKGESSHRTDKFLKVLSLLIVVGFLVYLYFQDVPFFWRMFGLTVGLTLTIIVPDLAWLEPVIPNRKVRGMVVGIGVILLPVSFGTGKANAHTIKHGKNIKVVSTQIFKEKGGDVLKNKGLLQGQEQLKFVGAAGEYLFFLTMDNATIIAAKYSDLHFLELKALN